MSWQEVEHTIAVISICKLYKQLENYDVDGKLAEVDYLTEAWPDFWHTVYMRPDENARPLGSYSWLNDRESTWRRNACESLSRNTRHRLEIPYILNVNRFFSTTRPVAPPIFLHRDNLISVSLFFQQIKFTAHTNTHIYSRGSWHNQVNVWGRSNTHTASCGPWIVEKPDPKIVFRATVLT